MTAHADFVFDRTNTPKEYQYTNAKFALVRRSSYLAADPGLGKTIIAAIIQSTSGQPAVYICPPFLLDNAMDKLKTWTKQGTVIAKWDAQCRNPDIMLVPDNRLGEPKVVNVVRDFLRQANAPRTLFIDEAHRFKNDTAKRTRFLFGSWIHRFAMHVFMSGTPMPSRPIELYPILSSVVPALIGHMSKHEYGVRYCAAFENEFGWDYSGASNMQELVDRIKGTFVLRTRKSEVLTELPPKTEDVVIIGGEVPVSIRKLNRTLIAEYAGDMRDLHKDEHLSTYRHDLGVTKVPAAVKLIKSILKETSEKLLVFAIHKDVIDGLYGQLARTAHVSTITGDTPVASRESIARAFQQPNGPRVLIANIQAGGIGFDLTSASRVIFVEYSWVPAENDQASDRAHRIGQNQNVLVQYLCFKNSLDRIVLETNLRKKAITNKL